MSRELVEQVRAEKPNHVLEIGCGNGDLASKLMAVSNCYYTGFEEYPEQENLIDVAEKLQVMGFSKFMLINGDTSKEADVLPFDFAITDEANRAWVEQNIEQGGTIIGTGNG